MAFLPGDSAFNITRAADRLHVHRNTLIYRLDKIAHAFSSGRSTNQASPSLCMSHVSSTNSVKRRPIAERRRLSTGYRLRIPAVQQCRDLAEQEGVKSRICVSRRRARLSPAVAAIPASAASCMAEIVTFWLVNRTAQALSRSR